MVTDLSPGNVQFVLPYVSREGWSAKYPKGSVASLALPVTHVRYTHTVTERCYSNKQCTRTVRKLQKNDLKNGLSDIQYKYVLIFCLRDDKMFYIKKISEEFQISSALHECLEGHKGVVYEGRGWKTDADRPEQFSNLKGTCLDIAYIGDYSIKTPPLEQIRSGMDLLRYGLKKTWIHPGYTVVPIRKRESE